MTLFVFLLFFILKEGSCYYGVNHAIRRKNINSPSISDKRLNMFKQSQNNKNYNKNKFPQELIDVEKIVQNLDDFERNFYSKIPQGFLFLGGVFSFLISGILATKLAITILLPFVIFLSATLTAIATGSFFALIGISFVLPFIGPLIVANGFALIYLVLAAGVGTSFIRGLMARNNRNGNNFNNFASNIMDPDIWTTTTRSRTRSKDTYSDTSNISQNNDNKVIIDADYREVDQDDSNSGSSSSSSSSSSRRGMNDDDWALEEFDKRLKRRNKGY